MLQSHVLFKAYSYHSRVRRANSKGRAELATPQLGEASPFASKCKEISRKNAPDGLSQCIQQKTRRIVHGA
jgi:hypothetical protein